MKSISIILLSFILVISSSGQYNGSDLSDLIETFKKNSTEEELESIINGITNDPEIYNSIWSYYLNNVIKKDSIKWNFVKDLDINFKTFYSVDSSVTSLGFSYGLNFDYAKSIQNNNNQLSHALGISSDGNIAFSKGINPTDFIVSDIHYTFSSFSGGNVVTRDTVIFKKQKELRDELAQLSNMQSERAYALWEEYGSYFKLSNKYYYAISPKFAFESNQDFSRYQLTPELAIDLGVKAWNDDNILAKLNVFDYPFALIRRIFGTDRKLTPYGATIPTIQLALNYIVPLNDTVRENITGNTDAFPRFKFEAGFRTIVVSTKKESIFFNANFRYYGEIGAPSEIKNANLDSYTYFIMSLQTSFGFYASYSVGKLPFDVQKDQAYSIGFNYNF